MHEVKCDVDKALSAGEVNDDTITYLTLAILADEGVNGERWATDDIIEAILGEFPESRYDEYHVAYFRSHIRNGYYTIEGEEEGSDLTKTREVFNPTF